MQLRLQGAAVGLDALPGLKFRPDRDHSYCGICGAVFQSEADRDPVGVYQQDPAQFSHRLANVEIHARNLRQQWRLTHSKTHPQRAHNSLRLSGRHVTPEAAEKLAAFGIISLTDLVMDDEVSHALRLSKAVPKDDAED